MREIFDPVSTRRDLCAKDRAWRGGSRARRCGGVAWRGLWAACRLGARAICAAPLAACALWPAPAACGSAGDVAPVPAITIYPGDAIRESVLVDREIPAAAAARGDFVASRAAIIGKIARRTLLPGAPIPLNAVSAPKIVANGAKVRIVLEDGVLTIAAYGAALQDGCAGDVISLRNLDTGLTVSGVIQDDGSVRVGGG